MFHSILRIRTCFLLACSAFVVGIAAMPEEVDARRFRGVFSVGGAARMPAGRVITRSSDEIAAETRATSSIDWSQAAHKGLDVAKSAIEAALQSPSSSSPPTTAFSRDTLSRLELEACVRESNWLDHRQAEYEIKGRQVDAQRVEIQRLDSEIESARLYVDRYSQRSVDAYNAGVRAHQQLVSHFNNITLPDIERDGVALNSRIDRFNAYCNGKRYYSDDLAAVESKLGSRKAN